MVTGKEPNDDIGLIQYMCRHLVALCISYTPQQNASSGEGPLFKAFAGTLICINNRIFFLTAGHILRDLEKAVRSGITIHSATLADTFGPAPTSKIPIPFDFLNEPREYIFDEKEELDFGLIALRPYYVNLLAANGIVAVIEKNWKYQSNLKFDGFFMLGLPEELTSPNLPPSGLVTITPTLLRVEQLTTPPEGILKTKEPRFIGKIDKDPGLGSIVGMSGGPLFGIKLIGTSATYWIVGLQSAWLEKKRIVVGCPMPVIGALLTAWAKGSAR